jgi:hypothetical protein
LSLMSYAQLSNVCSNQHHTNVAQLRKTKTAR